MHTLGAAASGAGGYKEHDSPDWSCWGRSWSNQASLSCTGIDFP